MDNQHPLKAYRKKVQTQKSACIANKLKFVAQYHIEMNHKKQIDAKKNSTIKYDLYTINTNYTETQNFR